MPSTAPWRFVRRSHRALTVVIAFLVWGTISPAALATIDSNDAATAVAPEIVVPLPDAVDFTYKEPTGRAIFAQNDAYLRGRATSTEATLLTDLILRATADESAMRLTLFRDVEVLAAGLRLEEERESEWPDTPIRTWSAQVTEIISGVTGHLTATAAYGVARWDIQFEDGRSFVLDTLESSGGVIQVGEFDMEKSSRADRVELEALNDLRPSDEPIQSSPKSSTGSSVIDSVSIAAAYTVDVLVPYTDDALSWFGSHDAVEAWVSNRVTETNDIYNRSAIDLQMRLVGIARITFNETQGSNGSADLASFQTNAGVIDNRNHGGADQVVLLGHNWTVCGLADTHHTATSLSAADAFALLDPDCGTSLYTFAHEVGHNQGASHNPEATPAGLYSYSSGHWWQIGRSVMSYDDPCTQGGFSCPRVRNFSNPAVYHGTSYLTGTSTRDNARTLRNTRATVQAFEAPIGLSDVSVGAYYYLPVAWLEGKGYSNSSTDCSSNTSLFCPGSAASRAVYVYWLWKRAGSPTNGTWAEPFTDVSSTSYYANAVKWAYNTGVTNGCNPPNNTLFCPTITLERGMAMTFLWNYEGGPVNSSWSEPFTDVLSSHYVYNAVRWAFNQDLTNGCTATLYCPVDDVLRRDSAVFIWRTLYRVD